MYKIGDKVVYPMHGAGIIEAVEEKEILGYVRQYYVMSMSIGNMKVMVPKDNADKVGLRSIIDKLQLEKVYCVLQEPLEESTANWNRRYMANLDKIKSGDIYQVAEVVKDLRCRDKEKGLSTGEKKLFDSAWQILISELVLVENINPDDAAISIEDCINHS